MEFLPLIVIALLFWFLIIQPQRRRSRQHRELVGSLEPGQEVVTAGGLLGRVEHVDDDEVQLRIAPKTTVRVARHAVTGRREGEGSTAEDRG